DRNLDQIRGIPQNARSCLRISLTRPSGSLGCPPLERSRLTFGSVELSSKKRPGQPGRFAVSGRQSRPWARLWPFQAPRATQTGHKSPEIATTFVYGVLTSLLRGVGS